MIDEQSVTSTFKVVYSVISVLDFRDSDILPCSRTELETAAADSDSHEASELSVGAWESLGTFLKVGNVR